MAVLTCMKISTRCCSSLLKNLNTLNRSFSNRAFHNVYITKCKTVLQKQIHSDKVIIYRQLTSKQSNQSNHRSTIMYAMAGGIFMIGAAYAMVPLYRILCQATGVGGTAIAGKTEKVEMMKPVRDRPIVIRFSAEKYASMQWNFKPQQTEVRVVPGETALAFYKAMNPTDKPIIGISTYSIEPWEAGQYFNKIQCFCFEEQRLNPKEEVDMPVFFFIDPEFMEDPFMDKVDEIMLSYTFFEAKDSDKLPYPGFSTPKVEAM
ncbi:cytochrome c oxidase assembly protein COX11, mitochondrial-like [Mytilus edulis]|uniref:cytochrome c oxidase assembly protein COX11, mitochondrial-like n=1 Tax=Mytilus edulis TaxID=6550 RepID=UPI0039EF1DA0